MLTLWVPSLTTLLHRFLADAHNRPVGLASLLPCCTRRDRGSGRWIRCWSWDTYAVVIRRAVLFQLLCGSPLMGIYTNSYYSFFNYTKSRSLFLKTTEKYIKDPKITYNPVFQRWSLLMHTGHADLSSYLVFTKGMSVS